MANKLHSLSKSLAEFAAQAANKMKTVFCRGVYLAENTSQAPSVEFGPRRGANYARRRLQKNCQKAPQGIFDSLSRGESELSPAEYFLYFPNRGRATFLYSSMVSTETMVPFSRFRGATHRATKVPTP